MSYSKIRIYSGSLTCSGNAAGKIVTAQTCLENWLNGISRLIGAVANIAVVCFHPDAATQDFVTLRVGKRLTVASVTNRNSLPYFAWDNECMMKAVQIDDFEIELSQPLANRPSVILITSSDGRRTILGDGQDPFTADEHRQFDQSINNDRGLRRQAATS